MKKKGSKAKKIILGIVVGILALFLLLFVLFIGFLAYYVANYPYTNVVEANWGIVLPVGYEEVYGQVAEASFHGDGVATMCYNMV